MVWLAGAETITGACPVMSVREALLLVTVPAALLTITE